MMQTRTLRSTLAHFAGVLWRSSIAVHHRVRVTGRIDYHGPGAHVVWTIVNAGRDMLPLTSLLVESRRPAGVSAVALNGAVRPQNRLTFATELDWSLLNARSVAVVDSAGCRHCVSRRQLASLRREMREIVQRPPQTSSPGDWLYGAANLAFGVALLGLGVFVLLWVIATG